MVPQIQVTRSTVIFPAPTGKSAKGGSSDRYSYDCHLFPGMKPLYSVKIRAVYMYGYIPH